jgi:hypothetical protein
MIAEPDDGDGEALRLAAALRTGTDVARARTREEDTR